MSNYGVRPDPPQRIEPAPVVNHLLAQIGTVSGAHSCRFRQGHVTLSALPRVVPRRPCVGYGSESVIGDGREPCACSTSTSTSSSTRRGSGWLGSWAQVEPGVKSRPLPSGPTATPCRLSLIGCPTQAALPYGSGGPSALPGAATSVASHRVPRHLPSPRSERLTRASAGLAKAYGRVQELRANMASRAVRANDVSAR